MISTSELQQWLSSESSDDFVVVDVRSSEESSISMIPGAISQAQFEDRAADYQNRIVVPYCTLGGRSFVYARRLQQRGIDVRNFQAGIIGWCREGLPLTTPQGQRTRRVHVYTKLLKIPDTYDPET